MFEALEAHLHYLFKDKDVLRLALSHKSHANEGRKKGVTKEEFVHLHNERLEFLGDSVLGLVITDFLSERFPEADEGKLSKMRSILVKEETLAQLARKIHLGEFLLLGKGEESTQGREKESILASTLEALLGGIYLDGGLPAVFETARVLFLPYLEEGALQSLQQDTKTLLQEFCQAKFPSRRRTKWFRKRAPTTKNFSKCRPLPPRNPRAERKGGKCQPLISVAASWPSWAARTWAKVPCSIP